MASFTPFISEYIFSNIGFSESVHNKLHTSIIKPCNYSEEIITKFEVMIKLMDNIRRFRTRNNITGKIPIKNLSILVDSSIPTNVVIDSDIKPYLLNECNILNITYEVRDNLYKIDKYIPNFKDFKQDLGVQCLIQIAKDANNNCLKDTYQKENGEVLTPVVGEHIKRKISINKKYLCKNNQISIEDSRVVLNFDTDLDANVQDIYVEKQILANIQQKRKLDKYDITQYLNVRILCSKIDRNKIKLPNIYQTNNIEIREVEEIMDNNKFRIETFDSYIDINIILDERHQISNSAVY